ncbi:MAG TPA: phospholipase D-like domain-containing protein [Bryobacteraceae bacterium]|nr:phospholipase D-like domain-containing protein [Bryobacteraceae bacterium]
MSAPDLESSPSRFPEPKEFRRWLQPPVSKDRLCRLAPAPPTRLGARGLWDHLRGLIRAWWVWLALSLLLWERGVWPLALLSGIVSLALYHTSPSVHPAIHALEPHIDTALAEFRTTMSGMTGMPLVEGNRVTIYNNGTEFYPAMLRAIESAQCSITMEQHIFWSGRTGRRFAEAFSEKARQGIPVKLLVDAVGSAMLGDEILKILTNGGCRLVWFRPIHWYAADRANQRTHRKSLIIDGRIAFTGGAGLADHWVGSGAAEHEWRDVQICVEGPAALGQQTGFAQNWLVTTGDMLGGHDFFPLPQPVGNVQVQTILSSPSAGAGAAGTMYLIAVQCAQNYLYIANPYFIPDARAISMLANACRRGVTVKLMVASQRSDNWWARQNSLRLYGKLLEAGVEIFEFQPTMLHQKTMVVDGVWATVGTANFDNRSFALSEETNVCFHDEALVEQLRRIFVSDLAHCQKIDISEWRRRGLWQQTKERLASLIEDQV